MIELAFHEAKQCYQGEPTEHALEAVDWILVRADWTRLDVALRMEVWNAPAPPQEIRAEFVGTFDWCCQWLSADPDKVRREGLPTHRLYRENTTAGGLDAVWEAWLTAKNRWMDSQRLVPLLERRHEMWRKNSLEHGQLVLF